MARIILLFIFLITACLVSACDAHDYWAIPKSIVVDSEQDILYAENEDKLSQDLFVRYQLDYEIKNNSSSKPSEVVVSATSYVNSVERITGSKVWHLDPDETAQGILTTSQLELGNSLVISLSACANSRCSIKEVLCPEDEENRPETEEIATFCYDACKDTQPCLDTCPAEVTCNEYCKDAADVTNCREANCGYGGIVSNCSHICKEDTECYATCETTPECVNTCISLSATCFRNCLATWTQCTQDVYESEGDKLPCALCNGEGLCSTNFDTTEVEIHKLSGENGSEYECSFNCRSYPDQCVTGCNDIYASDSDRMQCLDTCLKQFMFWCNDYSIPVDYVDPAGKQPCCFESFCQAELTGVVKSYNVECFNDTECGSGSSCSTEGLCVASDTSNCSGLPLKKDSSAPYFILFLLAALGISENIRRRRV